MTFKRFTMHQTPIRTRLSLSYLAVLIAGMGLAAVLAWQSVEKLYVDTQRENLIAQAQLIADSMPASTPLLAPVEPYSQATNLDWGIHTHILSNQGLDVAVTPGGTPAFEPYNQTGNAAPGIHTHVLTDQVETVVTSPYVAGDVPVLVPVAEDAGYVSPGDLSQRDEIRQALNGEPATAIRRVEAAGGQRVLYAAAPIRGVGGSVSGIVYLAAPLPRTGLPAEVIGQLAGAVLFAAVLAALAGTLLARHIARPLEGLAHCADAVAAGDLTQPAPTGISDIAEVYNLTAVFNTMIASLRQSNQVRNAFIADVTHELRTPLTVIKGTIETLEDGALDDTAGRGPLLSSMHREADRLIRLVNDLLVLTRADAGALQLRVQPLDLAEMVNMRCEHLGQLAARREIKLHVDSLPGAPMTVLCDPDRLAQILDNLLDNAIRYTSERSTITVSIRPEDDEVRCAVCDHGPGIPAEHLPLIFERFYRVDASRNRQTGGTGLGLSIVRALVMAQGGRIEAHSIEGEGTTILFHLPRAETVIQLPEN